MKFLFLFLVILPSLSFGAEFTSLLTKPNVLELKKYRNVSDVLELKYIHENPRVVVNIGVGSKETKDFFTKFMKSDLLKLNCDGDFNLSIDQFGNQVIIVNSIKACVDENNDLIAHSVGINTLSNADLSKSKKFIEDSLKVVTAVEDKKVNDSKVVKEITNPKGGVFSEKLESKAASK